MRIVLNNLHDGQKQIIKNRKRFNVVACGRRFGKTALAEQLIIDDNQLAIGLLHGSKIAYFCPTYKMLGEVFKSVVNICKDIISRKDEQNKRIETITGGILDCWSLDAIDSVRGRKYHRVILDEYAMLNTLKAQDAWEQSIRPLLTDYKGDAYFLSTPKGKNHYFHELFNYQNKLDNWKSFQMPTTSNPFIDKSEVEEARLSLPLTAFEQEYLAQFTDKVQNVAMHNFNEDLHVKPCENNPLYPLIFSIDFNTSPLACIVMQEYKEGINHYINIINEIKIENAKTQDLINEINLRYTPIELSRAKFTGDATGRTETTANLSNWLQIQKAFNLGQRLEVPRANPSVISSIELCNFVFYRHKNVSIDPKCKNLIYELKYTEADEKGLVKKDRNDAAQRADFLDTLRYAFNTYFLIKRNILKENIYFNI